MSARAKNRIKKQSQTPLGHKTTHRHNLSSGGACLALCGTAALRVVMSPRVAWWCVRGMWIAPRVRDQTAIMCAIRGEHTQLRPPCAFADTTVTAATSQRDGAERSAASAVPRGMHAAAGERTHAKPRGSARHIGLGAHRDDATPTPGAVNTTVGAVPPSPPS